MVQENSIETCIVSRVKQITSPGWMHETSAWTWCTGKTYRERVEREVGGGIGMGNTCKPMAVSFQCMTKFTTNKKKERKKNTDARVPGSEILIHLVHSGIQALVFLKEFSKYLLVKNHCLRKTPCHRTLSNRIDHLKHYHGRFFRLKVDTSGR